MERNNKNNKVEIDIWRMLVQGMGVGIILIGLLMFLFFEWFAKLPWYSRVLLSILIGEGIYVPIVLFAWWRKNKKLKEP